MQALALPLPTRLVLVTAPKAANAQMLALTARLAHVGAVRVLDGGNSFDAYAIARTLRSLTPHVETTLAQINVQRAFTCYQMLTLLAETPPTPIPTLVLDALSTFHDESVPLPERFRLLRACVQHLQRLSRAGPVVVSTRPPGTLPESARLLEIVQEKCDLVWQPVSPESPPAPGYLPRFAPRG